MPSRVASAGASFHAIADHRTDPNGGSSSTAATLVFGQQFRHAHRRRRAGGDRLAVA